MTLITKEDKDNYNSVVNDINQKISGLVDKIENLIKLSEDNSESANKQLSELINKANNLKTYVSGLLVINKQMDAAMPDECDYSWVYTERPYSCDDSDACGELS
jgi:chemotaxis signal transduction protein